MRTKFSPEEDSLILELVNQYGKSWSLISKHFPSRNEKQIRTRYVNYLDPNLKISNWTKEENMKLIFLVNKYGKKWSFIENSFGGRTDIHLKNQWSKLTYQSKYCNREKDLFTDTSDSFISDINDFDFDFTFDFDQFNSDNFLF
jgi:hypothetical protein